MDNVCHGNLRSTQHDTESDLHLYFKHEDVWSYVVNNTFINDSFDYNFYWIYIKKDTYLKPTMSNFSYDSHIVGDILKVAVPSTIEMIFITFITAAMHFIILVVSTTDSVAVFENGWRMVTLATEHMMTISTALVSIIATNWGC